MPAEVDGGAPVPPQPAAEPALQGDGGAATGDVKQDPREGLSVPSGRPGAAGERLGAERDAISGLRVDAAQIFGGSQYVYNMTSGHSIRVCPLSAEELDETRQAFVPFVSPAEHSALIQLMRSRSVVLLRGSAGVGKEALARALLLGAGHRGLYLLDPATDLSRVDSGDLQQGCGYVLADLPQTTADGLTLFDVQRLGSELLKQGARLVITVAATVQLPDTGLVRDLIDAPTPPDGTDIASAQLRWRLGIADSARSRRILAQPDVAELLRDLLDGAPAARAAELGRLLAEAATAVAEDGVAAKVRDRLELRDGQSFARWLENLQDLARQCLAISVATFGGEAYESVASLARDLEERLQIQESPDNPDRPRGTALARTRFARLESIHATLVESEVETRYGGARGLVVRYRDQGVALKVLEHVWSEYDEIREVLPAWLRASAATVLPTVGVRAAVAAGVLAKHAFETVRAKILLPWAGDESPQLRDAAATALHVVSTEARHATAAYNLVQAWSSDSNPRLQATAARAWRVVFELDGGTEQAWTLLHALAGAEEAMVIDAVCRSLTEYMALEDGRYCRDALDLIDQWTVSGNHGTQRRFVGELAFLYAAADLVDPLPDSDATTRVERATDDPQMWPGLLATTAQDPVRRGEVAALWKQTLNSPDVYEPAHEVLSEWAYLVESEPRGRTALAALLDRAADDRRTTLIARHLAMEWIRASGGRGAPLTGRTVLAYLDGNGRSTAW
ncbi:hypothetical protein ABIA33_004718 [Streptacidiphilus sp. MAP12-16]|uniref:hypothetical protein n=1 Tax=Streptacidiphilus sp. MAP12-16 TaxID=3156300 RepID=UPI003518133F